MYHINKKGAEGMTIRQEDANGVVSWIPDDPANRHYQEYLEWLAEGNTALVIEDDA